MSRAAKERQPTRTGGREATKGVIRGRFALGVGDPGLPTPPGWKWTLLTSVTRLETGHTPSRKHPEYWGGNIPWIGIKDVTSNYGLTLTATQENATELGIENSSARVLPAGTVCLSRTASVGYVVAMGVPMATSQDFVNWVCTSELDYRYLKYVLMSERETYLRFASGTTHQTIYMPEVKAFHILLPPLAAQRKTAAVLAAYDELIENNLRRIEILEEMAQAIYREWFVNFRYPGHEADDLIDSPLGPIPKGWEPASLAELADVNAASVQKGSAPAQINYIDISSVSPRSVDAITSLRFEEAPSRARRVVRSGDTIWSTVRPNRRSFALVLDPPEHTIASTGFAVLTPTTVPHSYLYSAVGTLEFSAYLTNHARGAAYPAVNAEDFEKAPLLRPPNGLLGAFHEQTAPMLELVQVLATTNRNLRSTRDLLLPKLVSGDIDVSDLDIDTS